MSRGAAFGPFALSLWFLPALGATWRVVTGHLFATRLSPYIERRTEGASFFFAGGAEAARVLLGTIAGS